jgi:FtsH-binding integral membrane protein
MVLAPILVFAAIILGIVGLSRISRRPAERKGRGFAVFGIVMGLLGLIFFIIALSALESVLGELFSGIGG